jgi:hypothetical protein
MSFRNPGFHQRDVIGMSEIFCVRADEFFGLVALDVGHGRAQVEDLPVGVDERDAVGAVLDECTESAFAPAQ